MADMDALPLAELSELQARLDFELDDEGLERIAQSALEDASDWARHYGSPLWTSPEAAPPLARKIVLRACKRYMENPNGYTVSRAGDETLQWAETDELGEVEFDDEQIATLRELAGRGRSRFFFGSATIVAFDSGPARRERASRVPVAGPDGIPRPYPAAGFPLYSDPVDPW